MRFGPAILSGVMVALAVAACRKADGAAARTPSTHVRDSLLAQFRAGLGQPTELAGPTTRDTLVRQLVDALEASDTAGYFQLALNRAEFAYLYYPTAREALPPYDLDPQTMWFVLEGRSRDDGYTALRELGGRPFRYVSHTCGAPRTEGENTIWGYCRVRRQLSSGRTEDIALFGLIVERHGRFKFVSMANRLG
jgi:hypothetical protein